MQSSVRLVWRKRENGGEEREKKYQETKRLYMKGMVRGMNYMRPFRELGRSSEAV